MLPKLPLALPRGSTHVQNCSTTGALARSRGTTRRSRRTPCRPVLCEPIAHSFRQCAQVEIEGIRRVKYEIHDFGNCEWSFHCGKSYQSVQPKGLARATKARRFCARTGKAIGASAYFILKYNITQRSSLKHRFVELRSGSVGHFISLLASGLTH